MATHRMYVLDPESGAFREVAIPVENANPRAVEIGPGGEWWVVLGYPEKLARYQPDAESWTTWDLGAYPHEIALDAAGRVWFNGHFTRDPEILGYFDPATEEIRTFEVPFGPLTDGGSTIPYGLRVDGAGKVWMTQLFGNRLVELDPETGELAEHVLPQPDMGPRRHDVGPDGRIWIPAYSGGAIAAFDPAVGAFDEFPFPLPDALPYVARVDPGSGAVWVGTGAAGVVGRLDPATRAFELVPLPSRAPLLRHLAIDPRTGDVWGAASAFPPRGPLVFRITPRKASGRAGRSLPDLDVSDHVGQKDRVGRLGARAEGLVLGLGSEAGSRRYVGGRSRSLAIVDRLEPHVVADRDGGIGAPREDAAVLHPVAVVNRHAGDRRHEVERFALEGLAVVYVPARGAVRMPLRGETQHLGNCEPEHLEDHPAAPARRRHRRPVGRRESVPLGRCRPRLRTRAGPYHARRDYRYPSSCLHANSFLSETGSTSPRRPDDARKG
jgi:virginiamycin B lyase